MLPAPKSDGPLPPRPESTAPILGSPLWASAPPGPLRPSCCPAFPGLALRPSISASASRSPQVGHAPGHGGAPAQHPALQQLLRVQRGPHAPHAVCRLPGPEGRRVPGAGGRGPGVGWAGPAAGRPADIVSASGAPRQVGSALRVEGGREARRDRPGSRTACVPRPGVGGWGVVCRHSTRND